MDRQELAAMRVRRPLRQSIGTNGQVSGGNATWQFPQNGAAAAAPEV
jgi:hypothetical protein